MNILIYKNIIESIEIFVNIAFIQFWLNAVLTGIFFDAFRGRVAIFSNVKASKCRVKGNSPDLRHD